MKEYIDRNAAEQAKPEFLNEKVEDYEKAIYAKGWNDCNTQYRENILSIPASDVVEIPASEVCHGKWMEVEVTNGEDIVSMWCNKCHRYHATIFYYGNPTEMMHYCPNCGAKMDGGGDND